MWWDEFARVLKPGGAYFAQHVGIIYLRTLREYFLGPQPKDRRIRGQLDVDTVGEEIADAGLHLVDLRYDEIKEEFFDIGAVVYFLRKLRLYATPTVTDPSHDSARAVEITTEKSVLGCGRRRNAGRIMGSWISSG